MEHEDFERRLKRIEDGAGKQAFAPEGVADIYADRPPEDPVVVKKRKARRARRPQALLWAAIGFTWGLVLAFLQGLSKPAAADAASSDAQAPAPVSDMMLGLTALGFGATAVVLFLAVIIGIFRAVQRRPSAPIWFFVVALPATYGIAQFFSGS